MLSPDWGEVKIGGLNMEEHKSLLRQKLSVVFQDFAHYEASLRDNITVSDPSRRLSDSGILDMARQPRPGFTRIFPGSPETRHAF